MFDDKNILVTGASSGLGKATVLELASRGANVAINHLTHEAEQAEEVATQARAFGVKTVLTPGDVSRNEDCVAIAKMLHGWRALNGLVNNAGVSKFVPDHSDLDALSADDFVRIYSVNVVGAFQMVRAMRALLECGAEQFGVPQPVVNVSSLAASSGGGSSIAYAASKGALNTMTLSLARALAPTIRVNAVCPAYIDSGWFTKGQGASADAALRNAVRESVPLRVALKPDDVAQLITFLLSDESKYQTGELVNVDAGHKLLEL